MAYGMEITKSNGVRYATPDTHFMHLVSITEHTTPGNDGYKKELINTGVTVDHAIFPFVRHVGAVATNQLDPIGLGPMQNVNGYWHLEFLSYIGNRTYRIYLFSSQNPPATGYGIAFYKNNQVVYSAATIPLELHQYTAGLPHTGSHGTLGPLEMGQPIAVYPGVWGTYSGDGGHVWSAVIPSAYGTAVYPTGGYNNVYAQFGYANSNAFDKDFSGTMVYINTSHYE